MNTVVEFIAPEHVEKEFISLLDDRCLQQDKIKPLSPELFNRIELLKAKADAAQKRQHDIILEG